MSNDTPESDPHLAAMIARAERRVAMLAELARTGMALVEEVSRRFVDGQSQPAPRRDPTRAFDAAARAVRLTVVLWDKMDKQLFALRNGVIPEELMQPIEAGEDAGAPAVSVEGRSEDRRAEADKDALDAERLERDRETSIEFDRFDLDDFRGSVVAIHAGLGREPDPSLWAEDDEPPSPEVGRADSRLQAASRVGGRRDAGGPGEASEGDSQEHRDVPPPGSGLQARVRPPHFGGGRFATSTAVGLALRGLSPLPEPPPKDP